MKSTKNFLLKILSAVMLSAVSIGLVGCKPEESKKEPPQTYGETGIYYFTAVEDEYSLTLDAGRYTLAIGEEFKSGVYSYDGTTLKLYEADDMDAVIEGTTATIPATMGDNVLTIEYNGGTYRFYKKVTYTVSYDVDEGSAIDASSVINGKTLAKPADPVKDGYYFIGWYADEAFTTPYAFGADIVTSNMTLYARFAEKSDNETEYVATMVVDGVVWDSEGTVGGVLYDLPTPSAQGKTFAGWWVSDYQVADKLTYKYDGQALAQDVNLYAVWKESGVQVSVNATGIVWSALAAGTEYTVSVTTAAGDVVVAPYKTTACAYEYDFASADAGDYVVSIAANDQTEKAYYKNKALARVSGFTVAEPSMLIFNPVENAQKYVIAIECGESSHKHTAYDNGTSTNFNFANCTMKEGGITFTVTAMANGYASSTSATYVYNRELGAVANVKFNAETGMLTWNAVEKALSYAVEVTVGETTDTYNVNGTALSLKGYTGNVSVKVKAVAGGYNSAAATEYSYTNAKLVTPAAVLNYNKLQWNAVENATGYVVKVNDQEYTVEANVTEFAIPAELMVKGATYSVSVQALAADEANNSYASDALKVQYGIFDSVVYTNGALKWSAVGGAYSYGIRVNGGSETAFDGDVTSSAVTFTKAGLNSVTVYAYDFNYRVLDSKTVDVMANQIFFDVRGGSSVGSVYLAAGDAVVLPETTSEGYQFAGWYNVPGGPESNGAKFEESVYTGTSSMMLYAYWTPNPYEITLQVGKTVKNAETGEYEVVYETVGTHTVYYKQNYTLPVVESEDVAKIFGGWYEDDTKTSHRYTDPNGKSYNAWTKLDGHTMYACWIDILGYELYEDASGKSYQIVAGEGVQYVSEITVPETYTDPETHETYPVTAIATGAFANCTQLQTLNIPDTIKSIYLSWGSPWATGSALYNCWGLKNINVYCVDGEHTEDADHETYYSSVDGMLLRHASPNTETLDYGVELVYVPYNRSGTLVVPDGVEHITTRSLYGMKYTKAIIPASVTRIGDHVFYSGSYQSIVFEEAPEGVDEKPLTIGADTFNAMTSLKEVVLPTRIGVIDFNETHMFDYAPNLTHIDIVGRPAPEAGNDYYTSIDGVVCNYDKTEIVYFPKMRAGEYVVPVEIQVIGERAFYNCNALESIVIKDNVVEIAKEAFLTCKKLSSVEFDYDRGTLEIADRAFYGCEAIQEIVFPEQLLSLGTNVFGGARALLTVTLNAKAEATFSEKAFADDDGVGYVTALNVGATTPAFEINSVFYGCKLFSLNIDANNPNFNVDAQGVLYNKVTDEETGESYPTQILYYPYGLTGDYTIPATITEIGEGVFENRANITSIEIPATVTKISARAFKNCVGLTNLTFAERTDDIVIEANAFEGCLGLESLALPEKMTTLANNAFANCINLEEVSLPSTLTSMTFESAFAGCEYLATVTVAEGNTAYVTDNGILYKNADGVATQMLFIPKGYTGDVVVPNTVTTIGANIFKDHKGITSFSFVDNTAPETLTIGASAFENAKALTEVRLPNGLKVIPAKAFKGSSVTTIFVPNTVITINTEAFANCEKLTTLTFEEGNDEVTLNFTAATSATTSAFSGTKRLSKIELPDRTAAISNYMFAGSYVSDLKLPANATSIGQYAFANCAGLTSFVMPNTITSLGNYAFVGCVNMKSITLSENLTSIPQYAFGYYKSSGIGGGGFKPFFKQPSKAIVLPGVGGGTTTAVTYEAAGIESIVIPAKVTTINQYAFYKCANLKSVTFAEGSQLKTLGNYAFSEAGITSFDMPDTVTSAGTYLFAGCTALTEATISSGVTTIPNYMFGEQDAKSSVMGNTPHIAPAGITSIVIPASVTTINQYAFRNCAALTSITFEDGCQLKSIGNYAFSGTGITKIEIPENTTQNTTFGTSIFMNCTALKEASLPKSVTNLNAAFVGCVLTKLEIANDGDGDLTNDSYYVDMESGIVFNGDKNAIQLYFGTAPTLDIPDGVITIADNAFAGNTSLTSVTLPKSLQKIGANAFSKCSNLKSVTARDAAIELNTIGNKAFEYSGLTSITLPGGITTIGEYAFQNCTDLKKADLYNMTMGKNMFYYCTALEDVNFYAEQVAFYGYTFYGCTALETFEFPKKVVSLGGCEFTKSGIKNITLPAGLPFYAAGPTSATATHAGARMFAECTNLDTVTMPEGYTFIPYQFFHDSSLKSFTFPKSVTQIYTNAFVGCTQLTEVNFAEGTTDMYFGMSAFSECAFEEMDLSSITNASFYQDGNYLFSYNTNLKKVVLPDTLTAYGEYMFSQCDNLETVEAKNIVEVKKNAFYRCFSLKEVSLSANATTIANSAFESTEALTNLVLPNSITSIGDNAFWKSGLKTITFSSSLTSIGANAFKASALTEVELPASVTTLGAGAFQDCLDIKEFRVQMGSTFYTGNYGELYNVYDQLVYFPAAAEGDNGYVELPEGTSLEGTYAFANAKNVSLVKLASSTTKIPDGTFANSSIRRIEIPAGVTSIGASAFANCLNLTEVIIPETVITIGGSAFSGCVQLSKINLPKNLATISNGTFNFCAALTKIDLPANLVTIEGVAFANSGLTEITIPEKVTKIMANAFANTKITKVVIPESVKEFGSPATTGLLTSTPANASIFKDCVLLEEVEFQGVPETMYKDMFVGCTNLTSVTFAEGWKTIAEGMFSGCTALSIEIPATVEKIEANAFAGWTAEQTITISVTLAEANALWGEGWNGEATVVVK